jgi:hypothetical protein
MNQLDEAVGRYQKLIEGDAFKDLAWAEALAERMQAARLTQGGRLICPFLRPNFVSRRQYESLVRAAEGLFSAIDRVKQMALGNPGLLTRIGLLPAEKMLAAIDPGYQFLAVTSLLDTHMNNGNLHFVEYVADVPVGVAYAEALADLFYDCAPIKEFRKRYSLQKLGGKKHLLSALLKAYKQFGGKKQPNIAILEFRQNFQATEEGEHALLRSFFRGEGYQTEIVSPDHLEYRGGVLRNGDYVIDVIWRRLKVQEFLLRYDLSHPLVRAYRDGAVCLVNSFRSELAHKKAIFDLLTDEAITASFPAAEKKAVSGPADRPARIHPQEPRTHGAQAERRFGREPLDQGVADRRHGLGSRDEARPAHSLRGAGEGGSDVRALPAAALRRDGDSANEGGPASARLPGQGAGLLELALSRQRRVLHGRRVVAHVHPRTEGLTLPYGLKFAAAR